MTWEPILGGALAADALATVRAIGDAIAALPPADRGYPADQVLFWAHAAGALDDDVTAARYDDAVAALHERVGAGGFPTLGLDGGTTGSALALAIVSDGGADDYLAAVDAAIVEALAAHDARGEGPHVVGFELLRGTAGLGVYLLERAAAPAPGPDVGRGLALVVDRLAAAADPIDGGAAWLTAPALLPPWARVRHPSGHRDVGPAHGHVGVVAVLARIAALAGLDAAAAARGRALATSGLAWLAAHAEPGDGAPTYPGWVLPDGSHRPPGRNGWCYGDVGVAAAAWSATARLGAPTDPWRALALACTVRPAALTEPGLCHGAAGMAHLCNRFYQASGEPRFADAARAWIATTLAARTAGAGLAGYTVASPPDAAGVRHRVIDPGLVEGVGGIGLALLAALGDDEPRWDARFACDVPARPG